MTATSKATDMAWRASVRMLIWTDMAPTCAKVAARAVAARKGMNMGVAFRGWWWGNEKTPRVVSRGRFGWGWADGRGVIFCVNQIKVAQ